MGPVLFVMAIMGCGDGQTQCAEARVEQVTFASMAACQAAMPDVLNRSTDLEYPEVLANCRRAQPIMAGKAPIQVASR